jgi:hypothetical protein
MGTGLEQRMNGFKAEPAEIALLLGSSALTTLLCELDCRLSFGTWRITLNHAAKCAARSWSQPAVEKSVYLLFRADRLASICMT